MENLLLTFVSVLAMLVVIIPPIVIALYLFTGFLSYKRVSIRIPLSYMMVYIIALAWVITRCVHAFISAW
jgi:hypothetical protein